MIIKVVFVNPAGGLGGGERSLLDLLSSLAAQVPEVAPHLVVLDGGPLAAMARALAIEVTELPMPLGLTRLGDSQLAKNGAAGATDHPAARGLRLLRLAAALVAAAPAMARYVWALHRLLRRLAPDIIHSNGMKAHVLTALTRGRRPRLVWHIRDFPGERPLVSRFLRLLAWRTAATIANSAAVRDDVLALLPGRRCEVVYNGIDVAAFAPAAAATDSGAWLDAAAQAPPAAAGTLRIGLLATYAPWKGHGTFIQAAARLAASAPAAALRFYIIGGRVYSTASKQVSEAELRALAAATGLGERLALVPFQAEPARALAGLDLVVHASTRPEPFGRTIVEAMAAGKPVVAAAAGGTREIITNDVDGLLVPPGDPDALVAALARLTASPELRTRLSAAGLATARRRFAKERLGPETVRLYRSLLLGGLDQENGDEHR